MCLHDLARQKWGIGTLASASVVGSTLLVGSGAYLLFGWLGLAVPLVYCLLLGALISPTDPIAVMGILKSAGAPKSLETQIAGESLFNDGVAVVIFLALFQAASGADEISPAGLLGLFLREAVGRSRLRPGRSRSSPGAACAAESPSHWPCHCPTARRATFW